MKDKMIGRKFGRLLVLREAPRDPAYVVKRRYYLCRCNCGSEVVKAGSKLRTSVMQSCGCLQKEKHLQSVVKHGACRRRLPEYFVWSGFKNRCYNKNNRHYSRYGGRGIGVSASWQRFENFFKDMGSRPSSRHSIERIDNDGDYCKENCIWATAREQTYNRSITKFVEYKGTKIYLHGLAVFFGLSVQELRKRLHSGWTFRLEKGTKNEFGPTLRLIEGHNFVQQVSQSALVG